MINRAKFDKARAAVLAKRAALDEMRNAFARRYGGPWLPSWLSAADRAKLERASAAYDRAGGRMFKLLLGSPRDWRAGVPAVWVAEDLTYRDAIAAADEPLAVTPPCAYGYSRSIF